MIEHNKPFIDNSDKRAVIEVINSSYIAQGEKVKEFEESIINFLDKNRGYACALSSGTAALFLALYALGVGVSDEVVLPTYVCSAALNAVYMLRAIPVLVDVNAEDFNISFKETQMAITSKTKAIIIPHIYGVPADLVKITTLGIPIVEDCAQAIGAEYKERKIGTIGVISIFSFYASKLLTTGHGGMVYSKHKKYIDKIRDYRDFDYRRKYYPRFNFQMTDFQAALGLSQLTKLDMFLKIRKKIALKYKDILKEKNIKFQNICVDGERVFYRFVIMSKNIKKIKNFLSRKGIQTIIPIENWELLHRYLRINQKKFPVAEQISRTTLSFPIYPALKNREIDYIAKVLRQI